MRHSYWPVEIWILSTHCRTAVSRQFYSNSRVNDNVGTYQPVPNIIIPLRAWGAREGDGVGDQKWLGVGEADEEQLGDCCSHDGPRE